MFCRNDLEAASITLLVSVKAIKDIEEHYLVFQVPLQKWPFLNPVMHHSEEHQEGYMQDHNIDAVCIRL